MKLLQDIDLILNDFCINPVTNLLDYSGETLSLSLKEFTDFIDHPLTNTDIKQIDAYLNAVGNTTILEKCYFLNEGKIPSFEQKLWGVTFVVTKDL